MLSCWCRLQDLFPFKEYFADAPGVLFRGEDYEADMERARGCWRHLRTMFQELEECRAFELLKVRLHAPVCLLMHACKSSSDLRHKLREVQVYTAPERTTRKQKYISPMCSKAKG